MSSPEHSSNPGRFHFHDQPLLEGLELSWRYRLHTYLCIEQLSLNKFPDMKAGINLGMVHYSNIFSHLSCLSRLEKIGPPVHIWKPRTLLFSVARSDALPGLQQPPPPSPSKEQFCFLWDDYGLFPSPWDTTAGIKGMNVLTKILSPLDPHGEFASVQEGFYYHSVVPCMKHRCDLVSHLVRWECHKSHTITGSPRESKFWPSEKLKNPFLPSF